MNSLESRKCPPIRPNMKRRLVRLWGVIFLSLLRVNPHMELECADLMTRNRQLHFPMFGDVLKCCPWAALFISFVPLVWWKARDCLSKAAYQKLIFKNKMWWAIKCNQYAINPLLSIFFKCIHIFISFPTIVATLAQNGFLKKDPLVAAGHIMSSTLSSSLQPADTDGF